MRVGFVSDLHGNLTALRAVLAALAERGVGHVVCLGDVATLGPEPAGTVELVAERCATLIEGNHDTFLRVPGAAAAYTSAPPVLDAIDWCATQLTGQHHRLLGAAVASAELHLGRHRVVAFHGSPADNTEDLLATTADDALLAALGPAPAPLMAGGHTHLPLLRRLRGTLLLNPGSVGMPFAAYVGGAQPELLPYAEFAVAHDEGPEGELVVELHRLRLDLAAYRAVLRRSDSPFAPFLLDAYAPH